MKKFTCVIMVLCVLCLNIFPAYASHNNINDRYSEALSRVSGLGIIKGDDSGFRLEDNITRAEFTVIICRLLKMDNLSKNETGFDDVPSAHWASGYIAVARELGLVNGVGDNLFAPDNNVTYNEALKIMVSALGYGELAEEKGGWPNGYVLQAANLGISDDAEIIDGYATRSEMVIIINNALDVKPLEPDWGTDNDYEVSDRSLYEILISDDDTVEFEGIYQENFRSSILRKEPICAEGMLTIGGNNYFSDKIYPEYFGMAVRGIAKEGKGGRYEIMSIYAFEYENNVKEVHGENGFLTPSEAVAYGNGGSEERSKISLGAKYLYNGRLTTSPEAYRRLPDAIYTLIDNTGDYSADIVMIEEGKSLAVDRISEKSNSVYFENGKDFGGRRGISLVADTTVNNSYTYLEDKDGNPLEPSDVKVGAVITIIASEDMHLLTIKVSYDTVFGTVTAIGDDNMVEIDSVSYKSYETLTLGQEGTYALDVNGTIIAKYDVISDMEFGYIMGVENKGGLTDGLRLKIISAQAPEKIVKTKDGVETISYNLQNDSPKVFTCRDKINYAHDDTTGLLNSKVSSSIPLSELMGTICAYRLDSKGEISHLNTYPVPGTLVQGVLNAEILAFGGKNASRGFATNEKTKIICIPEYVKTEADYGVSVPIKDDATYSVYGVKAVSEFHPLSDIERYNAEEVDVLILKSRDMDSDVPIAVLDDADICIVGSVSTVLNEEGESVKKLELLSGDTMLVKYTRASGEGFNTASTLRMGDLIKYSSNGDGTISGIKHMASIQGLSEFKDDRDAIENNYKYSYGECYDVLYNTYDYQDNDYVDLLTVEFGGSTSQRKVKIIPDEIKIYLYNRSLGTIEAATTDDIVTSQQSNNASKIYALLKNSETQAVIIIQD